jgi:hypothetical protein
MLQYKRGSAMPFKPMSPKDFRNYLSLVNWRLEKSGIDWSVFDEQGKFVCSIIISHGNNKQEVVAHSVHKVKKIFKEKGLKWPPSKNSKKR